MLRKLIMIRNGLRAKHLNLSKIYKMPCPVKPAPEGVGVPVDEVG